MRIMKASEGFASNLKPVFPECSAGGVDSLRTMRRGEDKGKR
jgi:hypothetical protein